jgi:FixJ family two-component response regulator
MNAAQGPTRPLRVAVVDDEPTMRRSFARLLRSTGYEASVYSSGHEFLDACQSEHLDCAFIDWQMPGLSGVEVITQLRRRGIDMPVTMLAAIDDAEVRRTCTALGTHCFLVKPADGVALLNAIESMASSASRTGDALAPATNGVPAPARK